MPQQICNYLKVTPGTTGHKNLYAMKIALRAANVSAMSPEELKKAKRVCDMMNDLENVSYHQKRLPGQKELNKSY